MTPIEIFAREIGLLAVPALFNLYFALAAIPVGFGLGILVALGKASRYPLIRRLSEGYIYVFRGSPFFIQLFAIYSLMLSLNLALWKPWGIDGWILHPLFLGPAILALNSTAYTAAILHGALSAVPRGEIEAARAFGMSRSERFRAIVWPHVIRIAWPAYTNEVVFSFHATALIYFSLPVIGEQKDLMNKAAEMFRGDYNVFLHYSVAALYFLVISLVIFQLFGLVYRRMMRHLPGAVPLRFSFGRMVR
jgi:His/Glu/Gln/Arg/opine family amino acid ABC transporter permease subunit